MMKRMLALCLMLMMIASSASAAVQLPNPKSVHADAKVEISENMVLTDGEKRYATTLYRCTFEVQHNPFAGDMPGLSSFVMAMDRAGFDVERRSFELTKREYEIRRNGTPVAFMIANYSEWLLFLRDGVALAPEAPKTKDNGFDDDWFDFDPIIPGSSGGSTSRCMSCKGSGDCIGCHGDGVFDNMYDSTIVSLCRQCSHTGRCQVCGGSGYYK